MTNQITKPPSGFQPSGFQAFSISPTPFERARAVYADGKSPRTFEWDLILHFEHGFVFSGPDYFFMGRPVRSSAAMSDILNPDVNWPREECDCWHVWLSICPNIETLRRLMPWPLPLVSFERGGEVRFVNIGRITGMADGLRKGGVA